MRDPVAEIRSVSLRRGMCFGPCPVYDVTLCRDGSASWHGEHFTTRLGDHVGEIDEYDFDRLAELIERSGFFGWDDLYPPPATDLPDYQLEVRRGSEVKRVVQSGTDEPRDFWVIAAVIDGLAAQIEWAPA